MCGGSCTVNASAMPSATCTRPTPRVQVPHAGSFPFQGPYKLPHSKNLPHDRPVSSGWDLVGGSTSICFSPMEKQKHNSDKFPVKPTGETHQQWILEISLERLARIPAAATLAGRCATAAWRPHPLGMRHRPSAGHTCPRRSPPICRGAAT